MVRSELRLGRGHFRVIVDQEKGNILSLEVTRDLRRALAEVSRVPTVRLVTLEGAGGDFSYGASIEEHRPEPIRQLLPELNGLIRDLLAVPAPTAAVVRGRCLGGGFEVALACDLLFASTDAVLGVPEIALGAFPPAASVLLPARVGASRASAAILTGQAYPVDKWQRAGLIELTSAPDELGTAVDRWFAANLAPLSAAALRSAALASRMVLRKLVDETLPELQGLYLEGVMRTSDANEGIEAFLDKRPPRWSDH